MGRKLRVGRSVEEKWQIVRKVARVGTSRRRADVTALLKRSTIAGKMNENREGRQLGERSAAAAETEKDSRIRQLERTLGRKSEEEV